MNKPTNIGLGLALLCSALAISGCTINPADDDDDEASDDDVDLDDDSADDPTGSDAGAPTAPTETNPTEDDDPAPEVPTDVGPSEPTAEMPPADTEEPDAGNDEPASLADGGAPLPDDAAVLIPTEPPAAPETNRIACGSRSTEGATVAPSRIESDTTWSGVVAIDGHVDVLTVNFTIEAGTSIVLLPGSSISFGTFSNEPLITARGTAEAPITFCGAESTAGSYDSIQVSDSVDTASVFEHVLFADGGGNADAALQIDAAIRLTNVQISNSASAGVQAATFDDDGAALSVFDSASAAILTDEPAVDRFPLGGAFEGNARNVIDLSFTRIDSDAAFHDVGIPYLQLNDVDVTDAVVEFDAGVEYQVATGRFLALGAFSSETTLLVSGTEDAPVVWRGAEATPGFWGGVTLSDSVSSTSTLTHLQLSHAGDADTFALATAAKVTLDHVELSDNATGMSISAQGLQPTSAFLTIRGTQAVPVTVAPNALSTLPEGGEFTGNVENYIDVPDGRFEVVGTVPNLGVPYRVAGELLVMEGAIMTLTPGSEFVMAQDSKILVGAFSHEATLLAVGTEEAPILFKGEQPQAGFWQGIEVADSALGTTQFTSVQISEAGGSDGQGAALLLRQPINVEGCTFSNSAGYGILKLEEDATDYTLANSFVDNANDAVGTF
jgi:hypothetical protein